MESWKIILWLVLFFPVGIYLMFKHSDWPTKAKIAISIFFLFISVGVAAIMGELMYLTGFILFIIGIYTFIKKKDKKKSLILLALGTLLFTTTATVNYQIGQAEERERIAIELEEKKEAERLLQVKHEQEIAAKAAKAEQKRIEQEKKLKAQQETNQRAVEAIEKAEKEPSKENYDLAFQALNKLDKEESDLISRLDKIKPVMEKYEEEKVAILTAIEKAEGDKTRTSYNEAHGLVAAVTFSNSSFTNRLSKLDTEIKVIEKEKAAEEKKESERIEAARVAAEAESVRIEAEAEAARIAAEEAAVIVIESEEQQIANAVYIAPESGTKYHYSSNCRGLSNANSIVEMDLYAAQSQGYELCGWED